MGPERGGFFQSYVVNLGYEPWFSGHEHCLYMRHACIYSHGAGLVEHMSRVGESTCVHLREGFELTGSIAGTRSNIPAAIMHALTGKCAIAPSLRVGWTGLLHV